MIGLYTRIVYMHAFALLKFNIQFIYKLINA